MIFLTKRSKKKSLQIKNKSQQQHFDGVRTIQGLLGDDLCFTLYGAKNNNLKNQLLQPGTFFAQKTFVLL